MNLFYNLGISLYSAAVGIAATRNNKARLMKAGQAQTFGILAEKVDTSASYIWIHVSSLGEFEQGRRRCGVLSADGPAVARGPFP